MRGKKKGKKKKWRNENSGLNRSKGIERKRGGIIYGRYAELINNNGVLIIN